MHHLQRKGRTRFELRWAAAVALAVLLAAAAGAAGCSGEGDGGLTDTNVGNGGQGAGTGGLGGGFGASGGSGGMAECAGELHEGRQDPLDLVIMLDKSGSMSSTVNNVTIWQLVTDALDEFVVAPDSEGLGVGLQYFPIADGPCGNCNNNCASLVCVNNCCGTATGVACANHGSVCPTGGLCVNGQCYTSGGMSTCDAAEYASLDVPVAALPGNATAISSSLGAHGPDGLTPTGPALSGAIQAATNWATTNPDHIVAVVLATDGVPTECSPQDINAIADVAAAAAGASPQVLTFVIGIGDLQALNAIAAAGGTQQAFIVNPNANTTEQFIDALNTIRGELLSCEFEIPEPEEGELDYGRVNVQFTPEGGDPQLIPNVADEGACDPVTGGWYYDNPATPTMIVMCPASCTLLESGNGTMEIVLGCLTVVR